MQKRKSFIDFESLMVLTLTAIPFILVMAIVFLYGAGISAGFHASVATGLLCIIPPVGFAEGVGLLFHYNIAHELVLMAAANGLHL